jgi:hypothetical protein
LTWSPLSRPSRYLKQRSEGRLVCLSLSFNGDDPSPTRRKYLSVDMRSRQTFRCLKFKEAQNLKYRQKRTS